MHTSAFSGKSEDGNLDKQHPQKDGHSHSMPATSVLCQFETGGLLELTISLASGSVSDPASRELDSR